MNCNRFLSFLKIIIIFFIICKDESFKAWVKDGKNVFIPKKQLKAQLKM